MKTIFMIAAMLGLASTAQAANCATAFGKKAHVHVSGNYLHIHFLSGSHPSARLRANGETASSYYFRASGLDETLAIVNKTVLSNGTGKVHYRYMRDGGHGNGVVRSVNLYCK